MIINHNMAALNTYNKLSTNNTAGSKSLEKLSSGLRINKAGDDAAGLAISEKMRGQIRGLDQASRNSQDGISLIQTAEGALNETHSILQRMRELAVQAGTDVITDEDRGKVQSEMDQLAEEITRIANTTEFNKNNLAAGGFANKSIGIGANEGQTITFSIDAMDAKSLGVTSDVINTNVDDNDIGVKEATIRDGSAASTYAGQDVRITSSVLTADKAAEIKGSSAADALNDPAAASVTGSLDVSAFTAAAATKATVTGTGDLNSAATVVSGALADADDDLVVDGVYTFAFDITKADGTSTNVDITVDFKNDGTGEYDQDTQNLTDLATIFQSKISGALGESVAVDFGVTNAGAFTFRTGQIGSDASITFDAANTTAAVQTTYKLAEADGATVTAGHGTGEVDGKGFGKLNLSIDGTEFSVDITANSTAADTVIAINNAANAAMGTTGETYASLNSGALQIQSQTAGANSSVRVLGSTTTLGASGTLHQELGLTTSYDNGTGQTDVGANGTAGKVSFNVNGQAFDVTIADSDDETAVVAKINLASNAAVGGDIASLNGDDKIVLSSAAVTEGDQTGSAANISIIGDDNDGRTLAALGLSIGSTTGKDDSSGILSLQIDGKAVNIDLTNPADTDTVDNIINKINADINAQLETSATYATKGAGDKVVLTSQTTGEASSIAVVKDNTDGATIRGLGLQVQSKFGASTGELEYTAQVGSTSETVAVKSNADIVVFDQAFKGLVVTKDASVNSAGTADITTSKEESAVATFTTDGRIENQAKAAKGILVDTSDAAEVAKTKIDAAITKVSEQRSLLGALQNRLEHTISNLGTSSENLTAAESRIRDVDMAKEMMNFQKNNILSQAAQAMLAQANQQPQGVLQLLR